MSALETGHALNIAGARVIQVAAASIQAVATSMSHKTREETTDAKGTKSAAVLEPAQLGAGAKVKITAKTIRRLIQRLSQRLKIDAWSTRPKISEGHTSVRTIAIAKARDPALGGAGAMVMMNAIGAILMRLKTRMDLTGAVKTWNARAQDFALGGAGAAVRTPATEIISYDSQSPISGAT